MRRTMLAGLTLISAIVAAALLWRASESEPGPRSEERPFATEALVESELPRSDPMSGSNSDPRGGGHANDLGRVDEPMGPSVLEAIGDRHAFDPGNPSNDATSEEDAVWLHRNGFLDPFGYSHLRKASIPELEKAAEVDLRAQVILAYNMAAAGTYGNQPIDLLRDAAARGSIFALVTWGDLHFSIRQYRNPALGAAYYQLATRRGYFTAAGKKYAMAGELSAEDRLLSDLYAEAAWIEIQALRRQRGLLPFGEPDLRPGFAAYLKAMQEGLSAGTREKAK